MSKYYKKEIHYHKNNKYRFQINKYYMNAIFTFFLWQQRFHVLKNRSKSTKKKWSTLDHNQQLLTWYMVSTRNGVKGDIIRTSSKIVSNNVDSAICASSSPAAPFNRPRFNRTYLSNHTTLLHMIVNFETRIHTNWLIDRWISIMAQQQCINDKQLKFEEKKTLVCEQKNIGNQTKQFFIPISARTNLSNPWHSATIHLSIMFVDYNGAGLGKRKYISNKQLLLKHQPKQMVFQLFQYKHLSKHIFFNKRNHKQTKQNNNKPLEPKDDKHWTKAKTRHWQPFFVDKTNHTLLSTQYDNIWVLPIEHRLH
jgi:hypothetical protein